MPTAKAKKTTRKTAVKNTAKSKLTVKKGPIRTSAKSTTKTKKTKVKAIPKGFTTVTPYLIVKNAAEALKFYKKAFGASEIMRFAGPTGKVMHAEIKIGDSILMICDEFPEMKANSPQTLGGTPVGIHLYVENVDAIAKKAVAAGAKVERPVKDQFYGDRSGCFVDPYGHVWNISTHIEDLSHKEILKRFAEMGC